MIVWWKAVLKVHMHLNAITPILIIRTSVGTATVSQLFKVIVKEADAAKEEGEVKEEEEAEVEAEEKDLKNLPLL